MTKNFKTGTEENQTKNRKLLNPFNCSGPMPMKRAPLSPGHNKGDKERVLELGVNLKI